MTRKETSSQTSRKANVPPLSGAARHPGRETRSFEPLDTLWTIRHSPTELLCRERRWSRSKQNPINKTPKPKLPPGRTEPPPHTKESNFGQKALRFLCAGAFPGHYQPQ